MLKLLFHLLVKEVFVVCGEKCFGVVCACSKVFYLYEHMRQSKPYVFVAAEVERHKPYHFLSYRAGVCVVLSDGGT